MTRLTSELFFQPALIYWVLRSTERRFDRR